MKSQHLDNYLADIRNDERLKVAKRIVHLTSASYKLLEAATKLYTDLVAFTGGDNATAKVGAKKPQASRGPRIDPNIIAAVSIVLEGSEIEYSARDIEDLSKAGKSQVRTALAQLIKDGKVTKSGHGMGCKYKAVSQESAAAAAS